MPTSQDSMGAGMPPLQAQLYGDDTLRINGAGTTQATATAITSIDGGMVEILASSNNTGAILPAGALVNCPYYLISVSGTAAKVYAPVGHTLNGVASSTGLTFSAATGMVIAVLTRPTVWYITGTATLS